MRALCLVLVLVRFLPAETPAKRPELQASLSASVAEFHLSAANLLEAAARLSSKFNFPLGVAWNGDVKGGRRIAGDWKNITVANLLKEVVAEDPDYKLEISNGVAHIQPVGFGNNPANFLNITLPSFSSADYTHVVGLKLRDQLNAVITERPLPSAQQACGGSMGIGAYEVPTSVALVNVTVRQILDTLLVNSNYLMWLVVFDVKQTYNGYVGTSSIFRKTTERDQPNWDFLPRYFDPVEGKERRDWSF